MAEPNDSDSEQYRASFAPVIEQAKGIVMAQFRCGPDEAFDMLCGISQHANVKLRVLAERLVQLAASGRFKPRAQTWLEILNPAGPRHDE